MCWFPDESRGVAQVTAGKWWRLKVWRSVLRWWKEETEQFLEVINNMRGNLLAAMLEMHRLKVIFGWRAKKI